MSKKWLLGFLFLSIVWISSTAQRPSAMSPEARTLASIIESSDYPTLIFGDGFREMETDEKALLEIVGCAKASPRARFLASELLRKSNKLDLRLVNADALAEAYCQALLTCTSEGGFSLGLAGNAWGYLWYDQDPGLGRVLLQLGNASVPALRRLATQNEIVQYEGSKEATIGNMIMPRAKDFAAYYLHRITGLPTRPIPLGDKDIAARDAAIEQLISALPN